MRATIKDVAQAAGVSTKTVSRVLKGERYVGADTRDRVLAAADTLGLPTPSVMAAAEGPAGQVLVMFHGTEPRLAQAVSAGVEARCAVADVRVIAWSGGSFGGGGGDASPGALAGLLEAIRFDGAIVMPPLCDDPAVLATLARHRVRTVRVSPATAGDLPAVGADEARAAAVMTLHLLALGHRRIGFVDAAGSRREGGHRAALAAAGIAAEPDLFVAAAHDFAAGARAGAALLQLADPPTAVFAGSDTIAAGVLTAAHARGLRVPEDVSVAGFGDEPLAAYVWPPLTTVRVSAPAIGEAAADLLLGGDHASRPIHFDLVERASVIGVGI